MKYKQIEHSLPEGTYLKNGQYKVGKVIGSGGMGITYLGEKTNNEAFVKTNTKVVIKELFIAPNSQNYHCVRDTVSLKTVKPTSNLKDNFEEYKERFKKEAEILHRFRAEACMVKVLDYFEENGTAYFTMDFIDAQDLSMLVSQKGHLSIEQTHKLLRPLGMLLKVIHSENILHRDIKPENILVSKKDQQPFLIDFGISKIYDRLDKVSLITGVGTPRYAPPEQFANKPSLIAPTIDVYSLGATYYYCLTGQAPQTSDELITDGKKSVKDLNPTIDKALSDIIERAMTSKASERTQTVSELIEQIDEYLSAFSKTTDTEETQIQADKETEIHSSLKGTKQSTNNIEAKPQLKNKKGLWIGLVAVALLLIGVFIWQGGKDQPTPTPEKVENTQETAEQQAWDTLTNNPNATIADYTTFLTTYPNGKHSEEAKAKKQKLEEKIQEIAKKTKEEEERLAKQEAKQKKEKQRLAEQEAKRKREERERQRIAEERKKNEKVKYIKGVKLIKIPNRNFYMAETEITNAQYAKFLNAKGNQEEGGATWLDIKIYYCEIEQVNGKFQPKQGKGNYPVICVNWYGARAYAQWIGGRLPTEKEWEYCAKGGQNYTYAGSNNIKEVAWYDKNSGGSTHKVKGKKANGYGLYDMSGNVWEWCQDKWYSSSSIRVLRGGSWFINANYCRVASRYNNYPYNSSNSNGFRVVFLP